MRYELDLSNYATKANIKNAASIDILKFAKEVHLASLKSEIDKSDIDKLKTAPVDLNKLNDIVKTKLLNEVVKTTVHDE